MDKFTVRSNDGSVDVSASVAAYHNALVKWSSENEISTESIKEAVDAVFAMHTGKLATPVLVSFAISYLNTAPAQFKSTEARIRAYLRGSGLFVSTKGKGGGISPVAPATLDVAV